MIKDIDNVTVHNPSELVHPKWGELTIDELSGGVKTLMLLYMLSDTYTFDLTACGDNCAKWIFEISEARKEDLYIVLRYEMELWEFGEAIHILNSDSMVAGDTGESFVEAGIEFIRHDHYNVWDHKTRTFTTHKIEDVAL